ITAEVERCVAESGVSSGIATVFVPGSTAGVTTIEYESGAVRDLKEAWGRIAPQDMHYHHNARWGDGNGHSHVRAAMLGASLTLPFASSEPLLGTWQQVVLADFDNRSRSREIIVQIIGE
ncbi:MAG: secondary thiamine-phosphate synthase enzyme YjbQ, partial [Candidatus Dadabacteria bacterium]|nr:secondary thiamine-phosphate synthase enzyme YjbQ [Candidatus Dadabacteria bacterium]